MLSVIPKWTRRTFSKVPWSIVSNAVLRLLQAIAVTSWSSIMPKHVISKLDECRLA